MSDLLWDGLREGCGTCEFGLAGSEYQRLDDQGNVVFHSRPVVCRRYPPVLLAVTSGGDRIEQLQPQMQAPDWCGEYVRRGKRDASAG